MIASGHVSSYFLAYLKEQWYSRRVAAECHSLRVPAPGSTVLLWESDVVVSPPASKISFSIPASVPFVHLV